MPKLSYPILTGLIMALGVVGSSGATTRTDSGVSRAIISSGNGTTAFPPSFLGHPGAYAFAVFGQLTILSLALAVLFLSISSLDLKRDYCIRRGVKSWRSPVNMHRLQWILVMTAVVCGVSPNLLVYLAWGEVSDTTMATFFTIDKVMKGLAFVPFGAAVYLLVESDETIVSQLSYYRVCPEPLWPVAPQIQEHYRTVGLIFLLSIAVTWAKASGLHG